jgi:hypothetical protein
MFRGLSSVKKEPVYPTRCMKDSRLNNYRSEWPAALRSQDMNRKDWTLGDGVADGVPIWAR